MKSLILYLEELDKELDSANRLFVDLNWRYEYNRRIKERQNAGEKQRKNADIKQQQNVMF